MSDHSSPSGFSAVSNSPLSIKTHVKLYSLSHTTNDLQATIAQQADEIERYKVGHERLGETINNLVEMVGDRNAEIERLNKELNK